MTPHRSDSPRRSRHRRRYAKATPSEWSIRIAQLLVAGRWISLLLAAALAAAGYIGAKDLTFDESIERMFSANDPVLAPYQRLKKYFGGNEIVLAVYEDPQLLAPDGRGLRQLESVSAQLRTLEGVQDVLSLAEVNRALASLYTASRLTEGLVQTEAAVERLQHADFAPPPTEPPAAADAEPTQPGEPSGRAAAPAGAADPGWPLVNPDDALAREFLRIFEGYTHGRDGKLAALACMLAPEGKTSLRRAKIIAQMRKLLRPLPGGRITGEPVMVADSFAFLRQDGRRLSTHAMILAGGVLFLCFRSVRWALIPLAVVGVTVHATRFVLSLLQLQLTMVSSMFTAIAVVISVATTVHLIVRYRELRQEGQPQHEAIAAALSALLGPIFWSCLTDAAGFAALLVAHVGPIRDFGLMMTIASAMTFVSILLVVPGLALFGSIDADPQRTWGDTQLRGLLHRPTQWMENHPVRCLAVLVAVVAVSLWGMFRLRIETDFTRNFRSESPIVRDAQFVEERLSGAGVMDLIVPVEGRLTKAFLQRVEAFQDELRTVPLPDSGQPPRPALSKVISLADADRAACGVTALQLVPFTLRFQSMRSVLPTFVDAMYSTASERPDGGLFRIMARTTLHQTDAQKNQLLRTIDDIAARHFPAEPPRSSVGVTGVFVLLSNLVSSVVRDQNVALSVATLALALMMWIALGQFRLALIALAPNLLPVVAVLGALGWLGIRVNMGAAMIAAVSIGLSIDSSIHYLWAFRRVRAEGRSLLSSIQSAQLRTGRAMVWSTLALVAGLLSLCFSEFIPTVYFGALASLTMIGGVLGNLFILPLLLSLFGHRTRGDSPGESP